MGGDLEERAAGAREDQVGGGERVGEAGEVQVLAQVVPPGPSARLAACAASSAWSRRPQTCRTWKAAPPYASSAARLIERAPSEPPNTSTHVWSGSIPSRARAPARSSWGGGIGRPVTR